MQPPESAPLGPPGSSLAQRLETQKSAEPSVTDCRYWHSRGYLPHFESGSAIQHITFRLADSLPDEVIQQMLAGLESLPPEHRSVERRKRIEAWMDAGHGSCVLREPKIGELVQNTLLHGDGERYRLFAWVVMPNHVHALIQPLDGWAVATIVQSWKSFTGRRISAWRAKARLEPGGPRVGLPRDSSSSDDTRVWHREYWDRFARSETHFERFVDYIHQNPVKAGLAKRPEDWTWSSANPRSIDLAQRT